MTDTQTSIKPLTPGNRMASTQLSEADFARRYHAQFVDTSFDALRPELMRIAAVAWDNYRQRRTPPQITNPERNYALLASNPASSPSPGDL